MVGNPGRPPAARGWPAIAALLSLSTLLVAGPAAAAAQPAPVSEVSYRNVEDSTYLTATLALPPGDVARPGVVLLSIAGTRPLVDRLVEAGFAVLQPTRRGFVAVEPLLQATYDDLAADALAAVAYLRGRAEVDGASLAIVAQGDDTPPAMLASATRGLDLPLVLLAPPAFDGVEQFALEQRGLAEVEGLGGAELAGLDRLVLAISEIVLNEPTPYLRETRLQTLLSSSDDRLPYNAGFPGNERQAHFFASPLWHDRLSFEPEPVFASLAGPALVLIGSDDPHTPLEAYLESVRRGLARAASVDTTVCQVPGRTRHTFTDAGVRAIVGWLLDRVPGPGRTLPPGPTSLSCLADPAGG